MHWTGHKVILRLLAPLHVGAGQAGNVQRVRPYVTGKALWGALTARLTRDVPELGGDYVAVGQRVNTELAFSYFYPTVGEQVAVWPWGETADEFAWRYLHTYAATALNYSQNTAEQGSLHETEFIGPVTRDDAPVHLVGYVFERAGSVLPWQGALPRLQLGGERTYGWGRVAVIAIEPAGDRLFDAWTLHLDGAAPICQASAGAFVLAHALAAGLYAVANVSGTVEPLVGRETSQAHRHGEQLRGAQICWAPGATIASETRVGLGPNGIWQAVL